MAPIIVNTKPIAATGVNQGNIPVTAGRISPIAPSISNTPIRRTPRGPTLLAHFILSASFSNGCVTFIMPAIANTRASRICTTQSTMFIVHSFLSEKVIHETYHLLPGREEAEVQQVTALLFTAVPYVVLFPIRK